MSMNGGTRRNTMNSARAGIVTGTPKNLNKSPLKPGSAAVKGGVKFAVESVAKDVSLSESIQTTLVQAITEAVTVVLSEYFTKIQKQITDQSKSIRRLNNEVGTGRGYPRRH